MQNIRYLQVIGVYFYILINITPITSFNYFTFFLPFSFNNRVSQCYEVFKTLQAVPDLYPAVLEVPVLLIPHNTSASNQKSLFHHHQTSLEQYQKSARFQRYTESSRTFHCQGRRSNCIRSLNISLPSP